MIPDIKFEQYVVHEDLIMIKDKSTTKVIGYVNKHPLEKGWFWFYDSNISNFYNSSDDATADLVHRYLIHKMNKLSSVIPNSTILR